MARRWRVAAGVVAGLAAAAVVFEAVPYSPLRAEFAAQGRRLLAAPPPGGVFTDAEIAGLPDPVRGHIEAAGYVGSPHVAAAVVDHPDVDLVLDGRTLSVRYVQVNAMAQPTRLAFIDTRMYGVPFQGLEGYADGEGRMRGVLGKAVTLFDETGADLDTGTLLTVLAEALVYPDIALASYVAWEPIDATHARATLVSGGSVVSGVFTFGPDGLADSFRTEERVAVQPDGSGRTMPWSTTFGAYTRVDGIALPQLVRAVWHEPGGDLIYFESRAPVFRSDLP